MLASRTTVCHCRKPDVVWGVRLQICTRRHEGNIGWGHVGALSNNCDPGVCHKDERLRNLHQANNVNVALALGRQAVFQELQCIDHVLIQRCLVDGELGSDRYQD